MKSVSLDALRDAVASAQVERILITAPDRLARKYVHQVLVLEELERFGCVVEFLDRPMSHDPHDQLLLQIRGAVAEYERTLIAERMRRGRLAKLRTGILLPWTCVPYGYRVDPDRPRDPSRVQVDPAEGAVVQEIFAQYLADGATLGTVAATLEQHGTRTAHGRRHWSRSTLRWMLHNPVYLGQVYAYRTHSRPAQKRKSPLRPVGRQGTTLELRAPETWLLVATIPPLISQELFDQAQAKLAENQQRARRHLLTGEYLLRALVSCGVCGYTCKGRPELPRYAYYICAGKVPGRPEHPDGRCPARYIPAHPLDDLVWRDLCEVLTHPDSIAQALERAQVGVDGLPGSEARRDLAPGCARAHDPEHPFQDLAMSAVRTPCRLLSGQEWSNLAPTRWRQRWQSRKGKRIRALKRHCRQGGGGQLPCTPSAMRLPCLPLVLPAPLRPVQMQCQTGRILLNQQLQQPSDLRDTVAHEVPLLAWRCGPPPRSHVPAGRG